MITIFFHAFGYLLLLFIVGLAWVYAFFRRSEINTVEGIVIGLGLSLSLLPLCLFYLVEFLGFKVTALNSILLILFLTLGGALIAFFRNRDEIGLKIERPENAKEITVVLLVVLLASVVILRMNYVGFSPDEAWYLSTSLNLHEYGEYMNYNWSPVTLRGPTFPIFIALAYALFGLSFYSGWLVAKIFGILSILSCYLVGRLFFDRKTGIIASVLLLSSTIVAIQYSNRILTDLPLMTFFIINIAIFYIAIKKENLKIGFVGGIVSGVSYLLKEPGILAFLVLLVYLLPNLNLKKYQKILAASTSGLFIPLIPWIYHFYGATNQIAVSGNLNKSHFLIVFIPFVLIIVSILIANKIPFLKENFVQKKSGLYFLFLIALILTLQIRYQYLSVFLKCIKIIPDYTSQLFVLFGVIGLIYSLYLSISSEKYSFLILSFVFGSFYGLVINRGYNYADMGHVRYLFLIFVFLMLFCSIFINNFYNKINKKSRIVGALFLLSSVLLLSYSNFTTGTTIHGYTYDYSYDPRPVSSVAYGLGRFSEILSDDDVLVTPTGAHFVYFFINGKAPVYDTPSKNAFLNGEWDSKKLRGWMRDFDYFVYIEKLNYGTSPLFLEDFDKLNVSDLFVPLKVNCTECYGNGEVEIFGVNKSSS